MGVSASLLSLKSDLGNPGVLNKMGTLIASPGELVGAHRYNASEGFRCNKKIATLANPDALITPSGPSRRLQESSQRRRLQDKVSRVPRFIRMPTLVRGKARSEGTRPKIPIRRHQNRSCRDFGQDDEKGKGETPISKVTVFAA